MEKLSKPRVARSQSSTSTPIIDIDTNYFSLTNMPETQPGRQGGICLLSLGKQDPSQHDIMSNHYIDGGGARGLSELIILKELMDQIAHKEKLRTTPRPCDYFDMIGGTATGGYRKVITSVNNISF